MANISVASFNEENISDFVELSKTEYESSITTDVSHTRWKHLDSPHGASTYIRLIENNKTVGRALLQPRLIYTKLGELSTACVTDVLIHPQHRSPPTNFINLTNFSANVSKFSSVYHTSNEVTEPFYRKLFRFPNPFSLNGYGFPTRISGIFFKISGHRINALDWLAFPFRWLISFTAIIIMAVTKTELAERLPDDKMLSVLSLKLLHNSGPLLSRSRAFLKWRLIDAPLWTAKVYCFECKGKSLGYIASRTLELNGLNYLVVVDFLIDTDITIFERLALRLWLIRQGIKSGADALFTMINPISKASRTCVGFPFIKIPDKFLPHRTPIFFRENGVESRDIESDIQTHMTLADIDYL